MATDDSTSEAAKAKFLNALEKKKNLSSPNKGESRATSQTKGAQSRAGGTRMFRRKSGSA